VQYILGHYPDDVTAAERIAGENNYAQRLAQAGYLVCVVEQRSFGQRRSDDFGRRLYTSCRQQGYWYMMHGRTVLGERCHDAQCAIDYLATRRDITPGVLAATGNSGGGTTSLWLAALDDRVTVCMPSCSLCSFHDSLLSIWHCDCNYVPGILEFAEMGDLAGTIAPRPFRAIAGKDDPLFPLAGVKGQFKTVKRAYELLGAADHCSLAVHDGAHAYNTEMALEWLRKWL
jgi:dienelactone hydrolase